MNYIEINRASWNKRTDYHYKSDFYDVEGFKKGKSSLNSIELELLGDLKGKSILHLQCHFGQDSISLARMGAKVTGVDLSDKAIDKARKLAKETGVDVEFFCCDIYDLPNHLDQGFDIVFTSYGVIGWLPDLEKWAGIVSKYLKSGGQLIFAEFHPVVWMFNDEFSEVAYNYFNVGSIQETSEGTYADKEADLKIDFVVWNHSLGEVIGGLLGQKLRIDHFQEYNYSPYACFKDTVEFEKGKYHISKMGNKLPMVFSIVATK